MAAGLAARRVPGTVRNPAAPGRSGATATVDAALPEHLALAAVLHLAAVGAGAAMLRALVRTPL